MMNVIELNRKLMAAIETKLSKCLLQLKHCRNEQWRYVCKRLLAEHYNERGLLRYKQIDFGEAIDDYSKAIECNDKFAAAYYNRGVVNYRMGCFRKALTDFECAVNLEPNNSDFKLGLSETRAALIDSGTMGDSLE